MVDLRALIYGLVIGAVSGVAILLWGTLCGLRNQIKEKRKQRKSGQG